MQTTQKPVLRNAQDYIELFRQDKEYFYDSHLLPGLMIGTQPDPQALKVLGEALLTDNDDVRDNIIRLLEDIGYANYPAYELRTPEVIALLIGPGFAKMDSARANAMDLLRKKASTATLSRYGDVFLKALKEGPEVIDFRLIAKAKPKGAWEEVDRLSQLPERKNEEGVRIARAALGDTKIEDEYIADAKRKEEAGDARGLADSLRPLVQIGTRRSLQAVCLRIRSPLFFVIGRVFRYVRLDAVEALMYAFPEKAEMLNPSKVVYEEDYIRIEKFCMQETGGAYQEFCGRGIL